MIPLPEASGSYVDAILERWLGFATPQIAVEMKARNWRPDRRGSYCPRCGVTIAPAPAPGFVHADGIGERSGELTDSGCGSCRGKPKLADGFVRLGSYSEVLREWILNVKYRGWAEMGEVLGRALGAAMQETDSDFNPASSIVVPMPMPWPRRMYRGIDHARVIAQGLSWECNIPMLSVLSKRNGPPQVSMPTSQRRRSGSRGLSMNSIRRFKPGARWLAGADLILVDDVTTTGASLRAATRLLRTLKPRTIMAAVVAVADDPSRRERIQP
ncbi:MAG: phosphoribosyltransferase family protein [Planctomycetota bacterium]|nr:phosphoribosyltransferase family protein [Planctomycetota bacterium]